MTVAGTQGDEWINTRDRAEWVHNGYDWNARPYQDRLIGHASGHFTADWQLPRTGNWYPLGDGAVTIMKSRDDTDLYITGFVTGYGQDALKLYVAPVLVIGGGTVMTQNWSYHEPSTPDSINVDPSWGMGVHWGNRYVDRVDQCIYFTDKADPTTVLPTSILSMKGLNEQNMPGVGHYWDSGNSGASAVMFLQPNKLLGHTIQLRQGFYGPEPANDDTYLEFTIINPPATPTISHATKDELVAGVGGYYHPGYQHDPVHFALRYDDTTRVDAHFPKGDPRSRIPRGSHKIQIEVNASPGWNLNARWYYDNNDTWGMDVWEVASAGMVP